MSTSSSQPSVRFYSRVYGIWCYTNSILVFLSFTLHTALFSKCYCGFGANRYICSLLLQKVMLSWGELQTSMCYLCERWCLLLFLKTWTGRRANDWGVTCELPPSFTPHGASTVTNRQESLMQQQFKTLAWVQHWMPSGRAVWKCAVMPFFEQLLNHASLYDSSPFPMHSNVFIHDRHNHLAEKTLCRN